MATQFGTFQTIKRLEAPLLFFLFSPKFSCGANREESWGEVETACATQLCLFLCCPSDYLTLVLARDGSLIWRVAKGLLLPNWPTLPAPSSLQTHIGWLVGSNTVGRCSRERRSSCGGVLSFEIG